MIPNVKIQSDLNSQYRESAVDVQSAKRENPSG